MWWTKSNYVRSAAMDSRTVISLIFIFFMLQFSEGGWIDGGNDVF